MALHSSNTKTPHWCLLLWDFEVAETAGLLGLPSGISWALKLLAKCAMLSHSRMVRPRRKCRFSWDEIGVWLWISTADPNWLHRLHRCVCVCVFVKGRSCCVTIAEGSEGRRICGLIFLFQKRHQKPHLPRFALTRGSKLWLLPVAIRIEQCFSSSWVDMQPWLLRMCRALSLIELPTCLLSGRWTTSNCFACLLGIKELQSSVLRVPMAAHFFISWRMILIGSHRKGLRNIEPWVAETADRRYQRCRLQRRHRYSWLLFALAVSCRSTGNRYEYFVICRWCI